MKKHPFVLLLSLLVTWACTAISFGQGIPAGPKDPAVPASSTLLNFNFSILTTAYYSYPGGSLNPYTSTITGELVGLADNSTSLPQQILIFSTPFNPNITFANPLSLTGYTASGGFDVSDGTIVPDLSSAFYSYQTSGSYFVHEGFGGYSVSYGSNSQFYFNSAPYNGELETSYNDGPTEGGFIYNSNGAAGINYTNASAPEPSTWALMIGGLGLLAFIRLREWRP